LKKIENRVSENKIEDYSQRILSIVSSCKDGITKRELSRRSQWIRRQERSEIINTLIEAGLIFSDGKDPTVYKDCRHFKN
jgi:chromosome segregation and condensation protein ScpB